MKLSHLHSPALDSGNHRLVPDIILENLVTVAQVHHAYSYPIEAHRGNLGEYDITRIFNVRVLNNLGEEKMNQDLGLAPRECARNAGTFLLIRLLLGSVVYLILSATFPLPGAAMLAVVGSVKANLLVFIAILGALFFFALFSLIVAFPMNNVLTSINKNLSMGAQYLRIVEWFIFIAGIVLLFFENPISIQVLLFGLIFYGGYLIIIGYLVFISNYLNRILGISMIIGGSMGYLVVSLTNTFFWFSSIGAIIAIITEYVFAIYFIVKARQIEVTDPKETITTILKDVGEATTAEIIEESSRVSAECKDRIPEALAALENNQLVTKRFSKEKKGYVWTLVR